LFYEDNTVILQNILSLTMSQGGLSQNREKRMTQGKLILKKFLQQYSISVFAAI
jgi:hypothetical protein